MPQASPDFTNEGPSAPFHDEFGLTRPVIGEQLEAKPADPKWTIIGGVILAADESVDQPQAQ